MQKRRGFAFGIVAAGCLAAVSLAAAAIGAGGAGASPTAAGPAVLLISIDGLHPSNVLEADRYGLKIPTLRRLLREGGARHRHAGRAADGDLPRATPRC